MSIQKNLITLCFATVFTLGLAACGSDATLDDKKDGEGKLAGDPSVADLFATAVTSMGAAEDAGTDAADALKAATDNRDLVGTIAVGGESSVAQMNAQAVLDAKGDVDEALKNAMMALRDATTAKGHAADLADDDANKATLIAALEEAIVEAEEQIEAIEMIRDGVALKFAVADVTGADEDEPMSAADHGQMVAMAIDGVLSGVIHNDVPPEDGIMNAVMMNDHTGKTWEEIVGSANVKDMRIAGTDGTDPVRAASFDGMTFTSETATETASDTFEDNGKEIVDAVYMGIAGTAFCVGDDVCRVEEEANPRKATGSWYFTPDEPMQYYVVDTATEVGGTTYMEDTLFARFGHWLTVVEQATVVRTYAMTSGNATGLDLTTVNETLVDESATYEGTAAGMSFHKEVGGDGAPVPGSLESGAFTADVTLTAKFDATPMLGGYINGFEGEAVDPDWRVTLREGAFTTATLSGETTASGQDGKWTATGYGESGERPTGIFGGFNAHFTDGDAAGAYATRK